MSLVIRVLGRGITTTWHVYYEYLAGVLRLLGRLVTTVILDKGITSTSGIMSNWQGYYENLVTLRSYHENFAELS